MAELRTIARPYAEAAFGLARSENSLAHWSDSLAALAQAVATPELADLIGNPAVSTAKLAEVVAVAVPTLSKSEQQMLSVLADNDRLLVLPEISRMFESLRNDAESVIAADVTSAFPMTDAQVADLTKVLEAKHGKRVKVAVSVDPALIGGVSVAIGDEVFDASVRGKLSRMATALMN
jgi:F-type H+-transporting ATPase subunit delta